MQRCVESLNADKNTINHINHVRLCKKMHLLCELIGIKDEDKTANMIDVLATSSIL